jgi:hypothetical protein
MVKRRLLLCRYVLDCCGVYKLDRVARGAPKEGDQTINKQ